MIIYSVNFIEKTLLMKLTDIILKEELGVAKRQLQAILDKVGPDVFAKIIIDGIQDENDQDEIVDAIKKVDMDQFAPDIF